MRVASVVIGVLAILVGAVWTLQGFDVLGGSVMSGHKIWAVIGPIAMFVGLVLIRLGRRSGSAG